MRYGWHGTYALESIMLTEMQERQWQLYSGDALGIIVSALLSMGGQKPDVKLFSEIVQPDERKKKTDNMSAEDIRQYVLDRLIGGGEQRR